MLQIYQYKYEKSGDDFGDYKFIIQKKPHHWTAWFNDVEHYSHPPAHLMRKRTGFKYEG